ncbi:GTP cyclohydrolase II RibA [Salinisphaera sp. SPP-AMP-43]|uniref:GTP cyclohydrolase II RibA n=1 Tax=Salinisphaera sp. SPP-AMP-43 TaxID=3121288 RepID=UPI003C6DFB49
MPNDPCRPTTSDNRSAVRCERAAAELRFGRPVRIDGAHESWLVLALDAARPSDYQRFAAAADARLRLFVTTSRAARLGLTSSMNRVLDIDGLGHEVACALAYRPAPQAVPTDAPAPALLDAAAQLARLALLLPALVCMPADASPFDDCLGVNEADIAALDQTQADFEAIADTPVPLDGIGEARFVVFRGGVAQRDQIAIVVGDISSLAAVPVRLHSACLTGDLLASLKCDCGDQLRATLARLAERGAGVLLYLDQEGRGTGIGAKIRAYGYQRDGLDTVDADAELGFGDDERRYHAAVAMLQGLGIQRVELFTNNPAKIAYLEAAGIEVVGRIELPAAVTPDNRRYLAAKASRSGHWIDIDHEASGR